MKIISHRGNLNGPDPSKENTKKQIEAAAKAGFDVEIDVWYVNKKLYLGHDEPKERITIGQLCKIQSKYFKALWIHCKNIEAFEYIYSNYDDAIFPSSYPNFFWHENDKITMTNKGIPWCYPGTYVSNGITVVFGDKEDLSKVKTYGVCTDYPIKYMN
jgi:hypothetical protein